MIFRLLWNSLAGFKREITAKMTNYQEQIKLFKKKFYL